MKASSYMAHEKTALPDEVSFLIDTLKTRDGITIRCDANAQFFVKKIWFVFQKKLYLNFVFSLKITFI